MRLPARALRRVMRVSWRSAAVIAASSGDLRGFLALAVVVREGDDPMVESVICAMLLDRPQSVKHIAQIFFSADAELTALRYTGDILGVYWRYTRDAA